MSRKVSLLNGTALDGMVGDPGSSQVLAALSRIAFQGPSAENALPALEAITKREHTFLVRSNLIAAMNDSVKRLLDDGL
jgi:hypothetical protein